MSIKKKTLSLLLAAAMLSLLAVSTLVIPVSVSAAPPEGGEYTYEVSKWTDANVTNGGRTIEGISGLDYAVAMDHRAYKMVDADSVGLSSGGKVLRSGTTEGINTGSVFGCAVLIPSAHKDTDTDEEYPVKEISGKRTLSVLEVPTKLTNSLNFGSSFIYRKAPSIQTATGKVDDYYAVNVVLCPTANGLLVRASGASKPSAGGIKFSAPLAGVTNTQIAGSFIAYDNVSTAHTISADTVIAQMGLTGADADTARDVFGSKTDSGSITISERWVDYRLFYDDQDTPHLEITLYLTYSGNTYSYKFAISLGQWGAAAWSASEPALGIGGFFRKQDNADLRTSDYYADFTVKYDASSYYKETALEFDNRVNALAPYTADKAQAIEALVMEYNTMDSGVKAFVKTGVTLTNVFAAFTDGKYFYDDFESGVLNWQIAGKITEESGSSIFDNLTETNIYSQTAAADGGDETGAFWGVASDLMTSNNALWLRKSFNAANVKPHVTGDYHGQPSVIALLKPALLPVGAKISSVSGKYYHTNITGSYPGTNNVKYVSGVTYKYAGEYSWGTIGLDGDGKVQLIRRTAERSGNAIVNTTDSYRTTEGLDFLQGTASDKFAAEQWVNFSLDYVGDCYVYTITGKQKDTNADLTVEVIIANAKSPLTTVGLVNAGVCRPVFDDISVALLAGSDFTITSPGVDAGALSFPATAEPGDTVTVTVNETGDRLAGGMLWYSFTPVGETKPVTRPLYMRDGSLVYGTASAFDPDINDTFMFVMPGSDVTISAEFVDADFELEEAGRNSLAVFGIGYRLATPGLQFGSRALKDIKVDNTDYQLQNSGTILIRNDWLTDEGTGEKPENISWMDWLKSVDTDQEHWKFVATTTLLDRCGEHVDYAARLVGYEVDNHEQYDREYVAIAFANYKSSEDGTLLPLESSASAPASYRIAYNTANPAAPLPQAQG